MDALIDITQYLFVVSYPPAGMAGAGRQRLPPGEGHQ